MIRRVRALPLRSRLALLVAVAVAVAVAAVSVTCWVIVQKKLYAEVDDQLHSSGKTLQAGEITGLLQNCSQRPSDRPSALRSTSYAQLVKADGTPCVLPNSRGTVEVTSSDKAVARDPNPGVETYRNGTDTDGQPVRVVTVPVVLEGPGQPVLAGNALLIALPSRTPSPRSTNSPWSSSSSQESASSAPVPPGSGSRGPGSAPSTN